MKVIEYGAEHHDTIVLLHGGGLSWWNFRAEAELLCKQYHVVLPVLDGHADSGDDFCSIEKNAERIIAYIDERLGGHVELIGGLSLGAQTVLEILAQRPDICSHAVIESAAVIPDRLTAAFVGPSFSCCYGLIRKTWFSRLQFRYLRIRQDLFDAYHADTCKIRKENMIAFVKASALYEAKPALCHTDSAVMLIVGERESRRVKRSAQHLLAAMPNSLLRVEQGLHHGEFSLNHAERYVEALLQLCGTEA